MSNNWKVTKTATWVWIGRAQQFHGRAAILHKDVASGRWTLEEVSQLVGLGIIGTEIRNMDNRKGRNLSLERISIISVNGLLLLQLPVPCSDDTSCCLLLWLVLIGLRKSINQIRSFDGSHEFLSMKHTPSLRGVDWHWKRVRWMNGWRLDWSPHYEICLLARHLAVPPKKSVVAIGKDEDWGGGSGGIDSMGWQKVEFC